ncbi:uncharacterized protein FTOL_00790 [Fusarium torulosum]|uniref:Uncharacterized protein n=1 Tax=Fusarium torulosum TaxID=33205 RepID=A0AAE8LYV9_9HYPO|nr:uncharacterized protein FTOL_00790 [Fusarium torulosum]
MSENQHALGARTGASSVLVTLLVYDGRKDISCSQPEHRWKRKPLKFKAILLLLKLNKIFQAVLVNQGIHWPGNSSNPDLSSPTQLATRTFFQNQTSINHSPLPSIDFSWEDDPLAMPGLHWDDLNSQMLPSMELDLTHLSHPPDNQLTYDGATKQFNQGGPSGSSGRSISRQRIDIEDDTDQLQSLSVLNEPSGLIISLPEYFFRHVITLYCVWDGESNLLRDILKNEWQSSGALQHIIRSMAAACLSQDFPFLSKVAKEEHCEALRYIKIQDQQRPKLQDLLACMLHGHTSSWLNPHDLAIDMFGESSRLLAALDEDNRQGTHDLSFFHDTMEYWAMLLSFLVGDQQLDGHYKQHLVKATAEPSTKPHPYSGISRETVQMLADTGSLIFKYRQHMSKVKFLEEKDLDVFRTALREARSLERRLLAHNLPDMSSIVDPGDPKTPVHHFRLMDEAYQYTGLLQIYRVFPDLLNERYAPWNEDHILRPPPAVKTPTAEERNTWLMQLAVHVLDILESIPFESRTRSGQPFIMVAVSSELRRCTSGAPVSMVAGNDVIVPAVSNASLTALHARRFIRTRLNAYAHVLPLDKIGVISKLVDHIWAALDSGEENVYWLDIAAEKGLGTMMG